MMSDILVQVSQAKQQFQDFLAVRGVQRSRLAGQRSYHTRPFGEEPVEGARIERQRSPALFKHFTGAAKRVVQEVIEAKEFGRQGPHYRPTASGYPAGLQPG